MPGIAAGNIVTTAARERFFKKAVDNIFTGQVLFNKLRDRARPWTGGHQGVISLTVSNRTQGGSYSGFDTLSTTQEDVRQRSIFNPSQYHWPVVFSGIQLALSRGPEAFLNLVAEEFSDVARNLREAMGEDLFLDGTGNSNKDIAGLVYHVDDATNVTTWQNLSRNTYTNLRSLLTAQSGALGFANLATDYDSAQRGSDSPDVILTTPAVFSIIERLMTPTLYIQYGAPAAAAPTALNQGGTKLAAGANSFLYRGVPVYGDEQCTAANIYTLNTNHLFLYEIDPSPDMGYAASKEGFVWTGWKKSQNQDAISGHLLWAGQLVGDSPRTMARRTGVTS